MAAAGRWGGDQPGYLSRVGGVGDTAYPAGYGAQASPTRPGVNNVAGGYPPRAAGAYGTAGTTSPSATQRHVAPWNPAHTAGAPSTTNISPTRTRGAAAPAAGRGPTAYAAGGDTAAASKYSMPPYAAVAGATTTPVDPTAKYSALGRTGAGGYGAASGGGAARFTPAAAVGGAAAAAVPVDDDRARLASPGAPSSGELQRLREAVLAAEARVQHFEKNELTRGNPTGAKASAAPATAGGVSPGRVAPTSNPPGTAAYMATLHSGGAEFSDTGRVRTSRLAGGPGMGASKTPPPTRPTPAAYGMNGGFGTTPAPGMVTTTGGGVLGGRPPAPVPTPAAPPAPTATAAYASGAAPTRDSTPVHAPAAAPAGDEHVNVLKEMRSILSEFRTASHRQTPKPPTAATATSPPPPAAAADPVAPELRAMLAQQKESIDRLAASVAGIRAQPPPTASPTPSTQDGPIAAELRGMLVEQRESLQRLAAAVAAVQADTAAAAAAAPAAAPASDAHAAELAQVKQLLAQQGAALGSLAADVTAEMQKPTPPATLPPPGIEALRDLERSLREKEELLNKRQQQLTASETAIQEGMAALAQREQACMAREARAAEIERVVLERVHAAAPAEAPASAQGAEAAGRAQMLAAREQRVDEREARMEERDARLLERERALDAREQHLASREVETIPEEDSNVASPRRRRKSPPPKVEKYFEGELPEGSHVPRVEELSDSDGEKDAPERGQVLATYEDVPPAGVPAEELEAVAAAAGSAEEAAAAAAAGDAPLHENDPRGMYEMHGAHDVDPHEHEEEIVVDPEAMLHHLMMSGVPPQVAEAMVHEKLAELGMGLHMDDDMGMHDPGMHEVHEMHPGAAHHFAGGPPHPSGYEMETD